MTSANAPISSSVYVLIGWLGGILAPVIGAWIARKIRVFHDNRKAHGDDLKVRVLVPLR